MKNNLGYSLVGVLVTSVIGSIVALGTTHMLVQSKLNSAVMEKREQRRKIYGYINNFLSDSQSCLNTLQTHDLSGTNIKVTDNPQQDIDRHFDIPALKDAAGTTIMDFSKNSAGELTHAETIKKLKSLGIDEFVSLKFKTNPLKDGWSAGRVILVSKTNIPGMHIKDNPAITWEMSGMKIEDPDGIGGNGDRVTLCPNTSPLKILCGDNVTGTGHDNGGGFVENTATVDAGVYVADTSVVCGNAKVKGNAKVFGNALVYGNAEVKDNALVYDNAKVYGDAVIQDDAKVYDNAKVYGDAVIQDDAKIYDSAKVFGNVKAKDNAKIYGMSEVKGDAEIKGSAEVFGNSIIYDSPVIEGNAKIYATASIYGNAKIYGNAQVWGMARVLGSAKVYGNANIWANAWIPGGFVYGNAKISRDGTVSGSARVYGTAHIKESPGVSGSAHVYGDSYLGADGTVSGNARVENINIGNHHLGGSCNCRRTTKKNLRASCTSGTCTAN